MIINVNILIHIYFDFPLFIVVFISNDKLRYGVCIIR